MTEAVTATPAAPAANLAGPHPDAALILACENFLAAYAASEAYGTGEQDCPFFVAVCEAEEAAKALEPVTMDGVRAMARVAAAQAKLPEGSPYPSGESWSDSFTGDWPQRVCEAVLRLVPAPLI